MNAARGDIDGRRALHHPREMSPQARRTGAATADPEWLRKTSEQLVAAIVELQQRRRSTIHGAFGRWTSQGAFGRQRMPCGTTAGRTQYRPAGSIQPFPSADLRTDSNFHSLAIRKTLLCWNRLMTRTLSVSPPSQRRSRQRAGS